MAAIRPKVQQCRQLSCLEAVSPCSPVHPPWAASVLRLQEAAWGHLPEGMHLTRDLRCILHLEFVTQDTGIHLGDWCGLIQPLIPCCSFSFPRRCERLLLPLRVGMLL